MYLSKLTLNPLNRFVRKDLANFYELHRTLLCAFPNGEESKSNMLYRVDVDRKTGVATVIIQSTIQPDWNYLDEKKSYLLTPALSKEIDLSFIEGQFLRFRLRASPTKRVAKNPDGTSAGYIKGLYKPDEQMDWLKRKGKEGGFNLHSVLITPEGNLIGYNNNNKITIYSVLFNGILIVEERERFKNTVSKGIGRGKRFGFGLLSIAPLK